MNKPDEHNAEFYSYAAAATLLRGQEHLEELLRAEGITPYLKIAADHPISGPMIDCERITDYPSPGSTDYSKWTATRNRLLWPLTTKEAEYDNGAWGCLSGYFKPAHWMVIMLLESRLKRFDTAELTPVTAPESDVDSPRFKMRVSGRGILGSIWPVKRTDLLFRVVEVDNLRDRIPKPPDASGNQSGINGKQELCNGVPHVGLLRPSKQRTLLRLICNLCVLCEMDPQTAISRVTSNPALKRIAGVRPDAIKRIVVGAFALEGNEDPNLPNELDAMLLTASILDTIAKLPRRGATGAIMEKRRKWSKEHSEHLVALPKVRTLSATFKEIRAFRQEHAG